MANTTRQRHHCAFLLALLSVHLSGAFLVPLKWSHHYGIQSQATTATESSAIDLGRDRLQQYFPFPLDDWQLQAGGEILKGNNVIVCAPTGK